MSDVIFVGPSLHDFSMKLQPVFKKMCRTAMGASLGATAIQNL